VTKSNGFWIWRLGLLALLYNYSWLEQLTHWTPSEHLSEESLPDLGLISTALLLSLSLMLRPTVSRPVCLGIKHPSRAYEQIFVTVKTVAGLLMRGGPLWREDGSAVYNCCWPSPVQSFSGQSPVGLATIFYCLRFETSLFDAPYDSQGSGGNIRPRLHTGLLCFTKYTGCYNFRRIR
jgi:hypothetical protein